MHVNYSLLFILICLVQSYSTSLHTVARCLGDLVTQEYTNSYNYFQLSLKFGGNNAYPGFASLFIKLSNDDRSKAHDIIQFLTLKKLKLNQLINHGIHIRTRLMNNFVNLTEIFNEIQQENHHTLKIIQRCHQDAKNMNDANINDYLERNLLQYHIEIEKSLSNIQHRITEPLFNDQQLTIFLLDDELFNQHESFL